MEEKDIATEPLTDEELKALEQKTSDVTATESLGGVDLVEVPGHGTVTVMQAQAAAEYEAYMERESARLAEEVESGNLSETDYEQALREMEESLAGLRNGSLSPDWQANPDDTEILRTKPAGGVPAVE